MSAIWYAAFSQDFVEPAKEIFKKLNKDVKVQVWDPEVLKEMLDAGIQVILARGATAIRIRSITSVPVVEIPIPFEDMVASLIEASEYGQNIAVIGYNNLLSGLDLLNPILNVNIRQIFATDSNDTYHQIVKCRDEKVDVIIGGLIQTHFASQLGMKYVRINLSEKALLHAWEEAEKILHSMRASTKKAEELKTILNTTKESYIAVDAKGKISLINQTAARYLPCVPSEAYGRLLTDFFTGFHPIGQVLKEGKEFIQEAASIRGTEILFDMIPLKYTDNQILGAVITFNDIQTITQGVHKLRDKIKKGFYSHFLFEDICGESAAIQDCIRIARKYAPSDLTVLILGETGVGKEMFAQSIHHESRRETGPFVAVNCAALPEGILESELFGYEDGAFTGARKNGKIGLFELAHKGTIFLDEISEMPLSLQSRLLRVIQDKKVMRLGGDKIIPVDVRIITATNHSLVELVKEKKFRSDLFYRLNVLTLKIPPLRERQKDIPLLAAEFLTGEGGFQITNDGFMALQEYRWPGNVRQLMHFIEKIRIISDSPQINGSLIRRTIQEYEPDYTHEGNAPVKAGKQTPPELTPEAIGEALERAGQDKTAAAAKLGIHRSTLWRYIKKYNLSQ